MMLSGYIKKKLNLNQYYKKLLNVYYGEFNMVNLLLIINQYLFRNAAPQTLMKIFRKEKLLFHEF